jgi:hypothetical protein
MRSSSSTLEASHRLSSNHRVKVEAASLCGCFYCERQFPPSEIVDWVDDKEGTAICPHCGIDSVLPDSPASKISPKLLADMHEYWFERSIRLHSKWKAWSNLRWRIEPFWRRVAWEIWTRYTT